MMTKALRALPLMFVCLGLFLPTLACANEHAESEFSVINAGSLLQLFVSLLVIVGLILALAWYARKMQNFSGRGGTLPLRVLSAISVGSRERVVLVQVGAEQLLLGVAPGRVALLEKLETPIISDDSQSGSPTFIKHLRSALAAGKS